MKVGIPVKFHPDYVLKNEDHMEAVVISVNVHEIPKMWGGGEDTNYSIRFKDGHEINVGIAEITEIKEAKV